MRIVGLLLPVAIFLLTGPVPGRPADPARVRQPVALVRAPDGPWLFVANRRGGSLSVIDTDANGMLGETEVGRRLSDLTTTPDGRQLLAIDEDTHELIILSRKGAALNVETRLAVSPYPVGVRSSADGTQAYVTSLWSRRLSVIDLKARRVARTIDLPFAPRQMLALDGRARLVVADSFGGRLAVVDPASGAIESVRELPAHNIRGLALGAGGREVLLGHQILNSRGQTSLDDVHWGNLLTNNVRAVAVARLRSKDDNLLVS